MTLVPIAGPGLAAAQAAAGETAIEEIVITAQRREENLQRVPIAVAAVGSEQMLKAGVQQFSDLQYLVPSLSIVEGPAGRFVNIRGMGVGVGSPQQSAGVPIHLDGMFIPREFALDDAYLDLERVEVLRGPQGTYVGQNSTGGAVFLVPGKPDFNGTSGYVRQTFGNFSRVQTQGALNLPISDQFAGRAAFNIDRRDSYTENLVAKGNLPGNGLDPGNLDRSSVRLQLLYRRSEDLQIRLHGGYVSDTSFGPANKIGDAQAFVTPWEVTYDFPTYSGLRIHRAIANIDWQLADGIKVRSMSGYQRLRLDSRSDTDNGSPAVQGGIQSAIIGTFRQDTFNQELAFLSTNSGPLQWVVGFTYLNDKHPFVSNTLNYAVDYTSPTGGSISDYRTERLSQAGFAEVTYDISARFQVIIGGRYTKDIARLNAGSTYARRSATGSLTVIPVTAPEADFKEPTGRIALNWFVNDATMAYVSASRGYKPGGFTTSLVNSTDQTPYKSEIVYNYEGGLKSTFLEDTVRANLSAYYTDYRNYQASFRIPGLPIPQSKNIPQSEIYGAEAQIQAVFGKLALNMNGSYLHTELGPMSVLIPAQIYGPGNPATSTTFLNTDGRTLNYAPKLTVNANVEYAIPVGQGTLTPRLQYSHISSQWAEFFQAPLDLIPARNLVDVRLTYEPTKNWRVEGYVTNLTDRLYVAGVRGGNAVTPWIPGISFGAPRECGARLQYRFE